MNAIENAVNHFQWLFTIIMALAITEGLKQFVTEYKDDEKTKPPIRWECVGGLVAFLLTAMLFTYGMTRAFFEAYRRGRLEHEYFAHLAGDSLAFIIEAFAFFVMSRSLSPSRARTFATAALIAFSVDLVWVLKCDLYGLPSGGQLGTCWIWQDSIVAGLLLLGIVARKFIRKFNDLALHITVCIILITEAGADIWLNRELYFPPVLLRQTTSDHQGELLKHFGVPTEKGSSMPDAQHQLELGVPLVVLGAVWLFAGHVLTATKMLNQLRDRIVGIGQRTELPREQRAILFWSDWAFLWAGILVFNGLLTGAVVAAASYIQAKREQPTGFIVFAYLAAALPLITFVGFLVGGIFDIMVMRKAIQVDKTRLDEQSLTPASGDQTLREAPSHPS
jgi:hypothetical protein